MDALHDLHPPIPLSGCALISKVYFAAIEPHNWPGPREGAYWDGGRQPLIGDVRIGATLDEGCRAAFAASGQLGTGPCIGSLVGSLFDGACWQRFNLRSLTSNTRFISALQLQGAARWVCCAVRDAAGRWCVAERSPSGFAVYEAQAPNVAVIPAQKQTEARTHAPSSRSVG